MNLHQITSAIDIITLCIAYIVSETLGAAFRAWVAAKMGDHTPEELGFLSLNPLVHIDPLGLFCLISFGYGWGNHVPINPYNFGSPYRFLKQVITYFSNVILHITLGISAWVLLIYSFGPGMFELYTISGIANLHPTSSSLSIGMALVTIKFIYINAMLAAVALITNGIHVLLFNFFHDMYQQTIVVVTCSVIAFLFFAYPLIEFMIALYTRLY